MTISLAQYGGGSVALFPLDAEGKLGPAVVSEHEGGAAVRECQEPGGLVAEAREDGLAHVPAEDQEAEDELDPDAPEDVAPDDPSRVLREEEAEEDEAEEPEEGDEAAAIARGVHKQENL